LEQAQGVGDQVLNAAIVSRFSSCHPAYDAAFAFAERRVGANLCHRAVRVCFIPLSVEIGDTIDLSGEIEPW
jgi:hypothetical protein